jgi:hypothetical protein
MQNSHIHSFTMIHTGHHIQKSGHTHLDVT